jgi:pilus assembly protein CpaF
MAGPPSRPHRPAAGNHHPPATAGSWGVPDSQGGGVQSWLRAARSLPRPVRPAPAAVVDYGLVRRLRQDLAQQVAARLRAAPDLDVAAQREVCRPLLRDLLADAAHDHLRTGGQAWPRESRTALGEAVMAALFGMGRFQPLLDDPDVENIEVNGCDQVWVCYSDGTESRVGPVADSDEELIEQLQLLAARAGTGERSFTSATPMLHTRLDDGSRLAAMAWITPRPQVVIRRHRVREVDLHDLVRMGTLDGVLAAFLTAALRAGRNIVVTGLQNAGKTTLIRALASAFPSMQRFGTIEREHELLLHELDRHPRVMPMEARDGSSERDTAGRRAGEVTLDDLVHQALMFNLRRIIVGEVRGSEVLPMLEAMSTGDGSLCTLHARCAAHAVDRLVTLCMSTGTGISDTFAYRLVAGSVDLIVHIDLVDDRWDGGQRHRHVSDVIEVTGIGDFGRPVLTTVFGPDETGRAVPAHTPSCLGDLTRHGFDPTLLNHRDGLWTRRPAPGVRPSGGHR